MNYTTLKEINNLLSNYSLDNELITGKISSLEEEIKQILEQIRLVNNYESSEKHFQILGQYHLLAAKLLFKYDFDLSNKFKEFIRDFDRLDDLGTRQNLYEKIKEGKYF